MPTPDKMLTTAEVAEKFGVDVRTVSRWVERGDLKPVIKGNGLRGPMFFNEADLPNEQAS